LENTSLPHHQDYNNTFSSNADVGSVLCSFLHHLYQHQTKWIQAVCWAHVGVARDS